MLPFHALAIKWCVKTGCLCPCSGAVVLRGGVGGRERVAGAYRPPKEPGKMVPIHGALVVKYTFPSVSLLFYFGSESCPSCKELLALGAQGCFG